MFVAPFFRLAAVSPARRRTFRCLLAAHLGLAGLTIAGIFCGGVLNSRLVLGNVLLVAGIVEGALLLGWRLTQMPKSQALEFLLVSPLRPPLVFLGEACVGLVRLGLVTLAGASLLLIPLLVGAFGPDDLPALVLMPYIWGAVTGLGLAAWAYEPPEVRRLWERVAIAGVIVYLLVGVLAGEHLPNWLALLPPDLSRFLLDAFRALHEFNPFGVMKFAMEETPAEAWPRILIVNALGIFLCGALLLRGAWRLQGHFQDEHYRPALLNDKRPRLAVGARPLAWWAVKRVTKFSGRINLWLAGGFTLMYAAYLVFEGVWPSWLGRQVFVVFDRMGGIPALTTGLVILAAVPAAFQYGLWDSSVPDRCRRLELLLLTDLDGPAYWHASACAAWNRGRGYFAAALVLWAAGLLAGQLTWSQMLTGAAAGVILWGLYFALGFWAFSNGMQANLLGLVLTLALPLATFLAANGGWTLVTGLLPPGSVYLPATAPWHWSWLFGPVLGAAVMLVLARWSLAQCDDHLRRWYALNQGSRC